MSAQKTTTTQGKLEILAAPNLGFELPRRVVCDATFAQWVRALLQNWRQGTVACQGRSDVSRTNKKPFKQKGTGRARAGTARSPLWRGGGVIHGPQPRTRTLSLSKSAKSGVLNTMFWDFCEAGKIGMLDWSVAGEVPKTAHAYKALKEAGVITGKIALFVGSNDVLTSASFANIPNVLLVYYDEANGYDLASVDHWLFLKKDADAFKGMVSRWI